MHAAAVHWGTLLELVGVSLLAGIGVSAVFSLVILGSVRATEASRTGHARAALGFGILAGLALLAFAAGITLGMRALL